MAMNSLARDQSNRSRDQMNRHFALLAQNPRRYPAVEHIRAGYRRSVCGAQVFYDRIRPMDVLIVRILGRQDVESALPEGKMRPWTQTHICSFVGAEVREPHP